MIDRFSFHGAFRDHFGIVIVDGIINIDIVIVVGRSRRDIEVVGRRLVLVLNGWLLWLCYGLL